MIQEEQIRLRLDTLTVLAEAQHELHHCRFIIDYLYEALGPANDDVLAMAEEAWEESFLLD